MEQCPISCAQKKSSGALALENLVFTLIFLVWIEPDSMEISQ